MRHDYNLPAEWEAMTADERSNWFTNERARRQAMKQKTGASALIENQLSRQNRRVKARSGTMAVKR